MTLCLAINYGGRTEIADAARRLAEDVRAGRLDPDQVDESALRLVSRHRRDARPDLLIRTAGELRVSNFLLWQISYAELWVTRRSGPTSGATTCSQACRAFAARERKFGGLPAASWRRGTSSV